MTKQIPIPFSAALVASLGVENRALTLAEIESGQRESIDFEAAVFTNSKPNRNGYLFESDWPAFAQSFKDKPFVKDHREQIDSLLGSITDSWLDGDRFIHSVKLTTREAMTDFVEGKLNRFSIAWYYDYIKCSICGNDWLGTDCTHWPGRKYKKDGQENLCQLIFVNPTGRHTSAVVSPASEGTEVLASLSAYKQEITGLKAVDNALLGASTVTQEVTKMKKDGTTPGVGASNDQPAADLTAAIEENRQASATLLGEQERITALEQQAQESEAILIAQCEHLLTSALSTSRLPDQTQARLRRQFEGKKFSASELSVSIEEARQEIASVMSRVSVNGPGRTSQMFNSDDAIRAAAYDMFGCERDPGMETVKPARLSGVRELYLMLTGDNEFTGNVDMDLIFSGLATTTNFPAIVKDSLNKLLVKAWDMYGEAGYGWWKEVVTIEHFNDLNTIDWVITGTVGSLPTVAERAEYTILPIGDNVETSDWTKYGGYIPLTIEAILRDNLMAFKQFPRELALAGIRNISEQVAAIFTSNSAVGPTLADGGALFNATAIATAGGHNNLLTTAIGADYTAWTAIDAAVYNQPMHVANTYDGTSYLGTGKKQALRPSICLVPLALAGAADALFAPRWASVVDALPTVGGPTFMGKVKPIIVPEWTDATDYAAVVDPKYLPCLMIGEIFGVMPQIFVAGRENDPAMFMNDETRLKVRQFLAVGVANYRGLHKSNVAG